MRFLARNYFRHNDRFNKLHPRYRRCPVECEDGFNSQRTKKCEDCPVKELDELFENDTKEIWQSVLGDKAYRYKFDSVLSALYKAIRFKDLPPDRMSVYTNSVVNVYESEFNLHRDIRDYEEMKARKKS